MPKLLLLCALLTQDSNDVILGNFDRPEDTRLWEVNGGATMTFEPRDPTDRNKSCRLVFTGGSYGGMAAGRQAEGWSSCEVLRFVVWAPVRRGMGERVDEENSK